MTGLYLEAWVHEIDHKHLKREQTMSLTLDAYQDTPLTTKLSDLSTQPEERKEWVKMPTIARCLSLTIHSS